jgi:hypothetical protein
MSLRLRALASLRETKAQRCCLPGPANGGVKQLYTILLIEIANPAINYYLHPVNLSPHK